jgi:superfamily I DNA/RNA helicase
MSDQVLAPDFLDMAAYYLAVASVDQILAVLGDDPLMLPGVDLERLKKHRGDGDAALRRVASSVDAGIDSLLRDAAEKAKLRVKTRIDMSLRGAAYPAYNLRADFLEFLLPRMKSHSNVLRDVFNEDASQAVRICQAAGVTDPLPRLFKLAGIRMASGKLSLLKRWTQEATAICGNPVSEIEEVAVDVVSADMILDRVAKNTRRLDSLDPTDPAAAEATEENADLLEKVSRVAERSKDPASVKAHAASKLAQIGEKGNHTTKISAHLGMTPEQEDAMLVRGKCVIAAGAGSGKTRVLAGKVIHHVQDLGLSMSNVMAMSFTKDSAEELKERIARYAGEIGFPIPDLDKMPGIGTTHSVGFTILRESKRGGGDVLKDGDISNLMRVAIAQVKMQAGAGQPPLPPKEAMSFFPNAAPSAKQIEEPERAPEDRQNPAIETQSPVQNPVEAKSPLDFFLQEEGRFKTLVGAAIDTLNDFLSSIPKVKVTQAGSGYWIEVFGPGLDNFWDILSNLRIDGSKLNFADADPKWRQPRRFKGWNTRGTTVEKATAELRAAVGADKAENALKALQSMFTQDPSTLAPNEKQVLEGIITHPLIAAGLTRRNVLVKTAAENGVSESGVKKALARKQKVLDFADSPYKYWIHNPAGQWFNIGASDDDFTVEDQDGERKDIPIGEFTKFTSFNKNSLKAPGSIFMDSQKAPETAVGEDDEGNDLGAAESQERQKIFSAVYGAYEWLKGNIPQIKGALDFDDMLIQPTRELIESPALLNKYQKQYKCILVDEAQDLNAAQHLFIGLVAGYLDPQTLKPRASGKMSADTFAFIGDDKQAIYEFRAADPDRFIEKSNLVPGGEGFTTKLLDTNFRSGNAIVDAANKLIAHNAKQIPMTCKSNPKEGEGSIQRLSVRDLDAAASSLTDGILADLEEVRQAGKTGKFYSNYGLAVRTNKELFAFAMKMIEEGIPFRAKKNFLGGPAIGPIIGLFTTLRTDSVQARNKGVLDGVKAPDFGINGPKLGGKLDELKVTDYYDFLVNKKGAKKVYFRSEMVDKLQAYADYLEEVTKVGSGSATDLINFIINFKGPDGDTLVDSLSASLMDDAEAMSEVQMIADEGDGKITPEMLASYAMAPINPLLKAAKKFPLAIQFTDYITTLVEANKRNVPKKFEKGKTEPKPSERPDAVQLGTVHGWKGLEVENLFIPMWDGGFPHKRSMEDPKMMESERRLAYVALTRGRQKVTILEPQIVNDKDVSPSVFMSESCIPLVGTVEEEGMAEAGEGGVEEGGVEEGERAASFANYLRTASVSDFLIPLSKIAQFEHMAQEEPPPEELEAQWGRLASPQEEN